MPARASPSGFAFGYISGPCFHVKHTPHPTLKGLTTSYKTFFDYTGYYFEGAFGSEIIDV